jgi:hypothetical protein
LVPKLQSRFSSGRGFFIAAAIPATRAPAVLDCGGEYLLCLIEIAAGIEHALNAPILRPLLDLVEVAMVGEQRRVGFFVGPVVASVSRAAMSYLPGLAKGARTPPHGSTFSSLFGRRFIVASPSRPPSCAPLGPSGPQTRERVAHKTAAQATTRGGRKGSIFSFWPGLKVFNPNFACGADVLPANVPPHSVPQPGGCSLHVAKDPPQGRKRRGETTLCSEVMHLSGSSCW